MQNLYYVVEKELEESINGIYFTGNKGIRVYNIDTQPEQLTLFCQIDSLNFKNTESEIRKHLDEIGFEDEDFNFVEL